MERTSRPPSDRAFSPGASSARIASRGVYIGSITLLLFVSGLSAGGPELACTLAFATLVCTQLVAAFDCKSETLSPIQVGLFSNLYLVGATLISFLMLVATIQVPAGAALFGTVPLSLTQWFLVFSASVLPDVFHYVFSH